MSTQEKTLQASREQLRTVLTKAPPAFLPVLAKQPLPLLCLLVGVVVGVAAVKLPWRRVISGRIRF